MNLINLYKAKCWDNFEEFIEFESDWKFTYEKLS